MSPDEPLQNRLPLYGAAVFVFMMLLVLAFRAGVDYQKFSGPPGSECKAGMRRETGGAAVCENGFWQLLPPGTPWPGEEEKKP